jgi:NAD(P)H-flavin reductase
LTTVPAPATILKTIPLSVDTSLFTLSLDDGIWRERFHFLPGQFVQLSVPAVGEVPISVASPPRGDGTLELCVKKVGRVTSRLHALGPGDRLGIRGPFGNGFPVENMAGRDILLIAGGLGIAPLRSLLFHLLARRHDFGTITIMYGAREPAAMLFREELVSLVKNDDPRLLLTVDFVRDAALEGTFCNICLLPALLQGIRFDGRNTSVVVCGPPVIYRCIIDELLAAGCADEQIFLSLERRMKCGQGYCCHCAVGGLFCCTDGPVFTYRELKNIPGAI